MANDPKVHHRHSLRLKEYDYTWAGVYFVTIVSFERKCLFGEIVAGAVRKNHFGQIVSDEWLKTALIRPQVMVDEGEFVVMPNHFHGIIRIMDSGLSHAGATCQVAPPQLSSGPKLVSNSLGAIIGQFKSVSSKRINQLRGVQGVPVWQRNYYERIVRTPEDLDHIYEYIRSNPLNWEQDQENSFAKK